MITTDDGSKRRAREVVQVILPEDQRGQNLFQRLAAGRRVLVKGRLTHRPNIGQTKDGNTVAYPNPVVYMDSLEFLDEPLLNVAERVFNILQAECELINDEQKTQFLASLKTYEAKLRSTNEERTVRGTQQENVTKESDNPDDIGFN